MPTSPQWHNADITKNNYSQQDLGVFVITKKQYNVKAMSLGFKSGVCTESSTRNRTHQWSFLATLRAGIWLYYIPSSPLSVTTPQQHHSYLAKMPLCNRGSKADKLSTLTMID